MNYATGYTVNLIDIYKTFNVKRLKVSAKTCEEIIGNRHKEMIMYKVMKYCIRLILSDIINNKSTFNLPTGKKKCFIEMQRATDEEFAAARRNGKWLDVDFLASNFSGYYLTLTYRRGEVRQWRYIYLDPTNKGLITQHTNNGEAYYTKQETNITYYMPELQKEFPYLCKSDIRTIVNYGWRYIYIAILFGCDIQIVSTSYKFWFYIGKLGKDPLKHYAYYKRKLVRKMMFIFRKQHKNWDGYYYIPLTNEDLEIFKPRGRKRTNFVFYDKLCFKFSDVCAIYYTGKSKLLRFKALVDRGFIYRSKKLKLKSPELIEIEPIRNFQDLLVNNRDYELL